MVFELLFLSYGKRLVRITTTFKREICRNLDKKVRLRQIFMIFLFKRLIILFRLYQSVDGLEIRNAYGCDRHDAEVVQCRFPLYLIIYYI